MDMTFEAASMAANAEMTSVTVKTVTRWVTMAKALTALVASVSCPTLGSHSLSAVAPDNIFGKELALAGA